MSVTTPAAREPPQPSPWLICNVGLNAVTMREMPKEDWRYLRGLVDQLIERVSNRMNAEVGAVLAREDMTARAKRAEVHALAMKHHQLIIDCFEDWGPGMIWAKVRLMMRMGVLEERDLAGLSRETADHIRLTLQDEV